MAHSAETTMGYGIPAPEIRTERPEAEVVKGTRKAVHSRVGRGWGVGRLAAIAGLGVLGGFGSEAVSTLRLFGTDPKIDEIRIAIGSQLAHHPRPLSAPLETDVIDQAPLREALVRLQGNEDLEAVMPDDMVDPYRVRVGTDVFSLQTIRVTEGSEDTFYLRREKGGALYLGSESDGGLRGAIARFDGAIEAAKAAIGQPVVLAEYRE